MSRSDVSVHPGNEPVARDDGHGPGPMPRRFGHSRRRPGPMRRLPGAARRCSGEEAKPAGITRVAPSHSRWLATPGAFRTSCESIPGHPRSADLPWPRAVDRPRSRRERRQQERGDALIKAAWSGCVENLEVLLEHGADPEIRDTWGQTALDVAERFPRRAAAAFLRSRKT